MKKSSILKAVIVSLFVAKSSFAAPTMTMTPQLAKQTINEFVAATSLSGLATSDGELLVEKLLSDVDGKNAALNIASTIKQITDQGATAAQKKLVLKGDNEMVGKLRVSLVVKAVTRLLAAQVQLQAASEEAKSSPNPLAADAFKALRAIALGKANKFLATGETADGWNSANIEGLVSYLEPMIESLAKGGVAPLTSFMDTSRAQADKLKMNEATFYKQAVEKCAGA